MHREKSVSEQVSPQNVARLGVGSRWRCEALGMELVWVPPGSFLMGATTAPGPGHDLEAGKDEAPAHEVTITRGFWLGRFPVTNRQIRAFAEETGAVVGSLGRAGFDGLEQPAVEIDWYDAVRFCAWASRRTGLCVTLPTEAEWEYAARGTDGRKYPWGDAPLSLDRAWARGAGASREAIPATAPVGARLAGAGPFGAEEQIGNIWEWCAHTYVPYPRSPQHDPYLNNHREALDQLCQIPDLRCQSNDAFLRAIRWLYRKAFLHAIRGGSWRGSAELLRAAARDGVYAENREMHIGLRVVVRD